MAGFFAWVSFEKKSLESDPELPEFPEFDVTELGSHAKFCISDNTAAYVGSANLTKPGLGEHFELGVLVRGQAALDMRRFWDFAVHYKLFRVYAY